MLRGRSSYGHLWRKKSWGLSEAESCRLNVFEMKCLRSMLGITRWDRTVNDEIRRRAEIVETLVEKVNKLGLRVLGRIERMD